MLREPPVPATNCQADTSPPPETSRVAPLLTVTFGALTLTVLLGRRFKSGLLLTLSEARFGNGSSGWILATLPITSSPSSDVDVRLPGARVTLWLPSR